MTDDRLHFIKDSATELTQRLNILEYPINMLELFEQHYADKYFIHYADFNPRAEIVSNYYPDFDECILLINNNVVKPKLMKRLNFSLAHELGHLVLKHYRYQDNIKEQELEADEFAAQFLMPEDEIFFMSKKLGFISEYFFVSEIAASVRLQNMKERRHIYNRNLYNEIYECRNANEIFT